MGEKKRKLPRLDIKVTRHAASPCINCRTMLDTSSLIDLEDDMRGPRGGDVTVCLKCRHVMAYNDDMSLRDLNDEEIVDIAGMPQLVATVKLMGAYDQEKELAARRRAGNPQVGDEEVSRQVHRAARRAAIAFLKESRAAQARSKR
jgi:hypothetical protein